MASDVAAGPPQKAEVGAEGPVEGFVELLTAAKVSGWAWQRGRVAPLEMAVLVDGVEVGLCMADRFRTDLQQSGKGEGRHAFEFVFAQAVARYAEPGFVQVRAVGHERALRATETLALGLKAALAAVVEPVVVAEPVVAAPVVAEPVVAAPVVAAPVVDAVVAAGGAAEGVADGAERAPVAIVSAGEGRGARIALLAELCRRAFGVAPVLIHTGAAADRPQDAQAMVVPSGSVAGLTRAALALAAGTRCEAVLVLSAELPAMLIGTLLRQAHGCPLIVDVGEQPADLAHGTESGGAEGGDAEPERLAQALAQDPQQADRADHPAWRALARSLVDEADGVTIATTALRHLHGGMAVRQGLDERRFDPARCDRAGVRASYGYGPDDRVLVFVGAPTPRDGVAELGDALERLGDARLALCIFGPVSDAGLRDRLTSYRRVRLALHPALAPERVAGVVAMADCVPVLMRSPPGRVPGRLIDALAMDVPVIATPAACIADLAAMGAVRLVADAPALDAALVALARAPLACGHAGLRDVFLGELSHAVNAARLALAIEAGLQPRPRELPRTAALLRLLAQQTGAVLPAIGLNGRRRGEAAVGEPVATVAGVVTGGVVAGKGRRGRPDLVVLAGGNRSGLFGERGDRLVAHLVQSGTVGRVVQFDAPISAAALEALTAGAGIGGGGHRGSLMYASTMRRVLGLADSAGFARRTFVHRSGEEPEHALGRALPPASGFAAFMAETLRELEVGPSPLLLLTGGSRQLAAGVEAVAPGLVWADLEGGAAGLEMAPLVDVAFCRSVLQHQALVSVRADTVLLPDGLEMAVAGPAMPGELAALPPQSVLYLTGDGLSGDAAVEAVLAGASALATGFPQASILLAIDAVAVDAPGNLRVLGWRSADALRDLACHLDAAVAAGGDVLGASGLYAALGAGVPVVAALAARLGDLAALTVSAAALGGLHPALAQTLAVRPAARPADPARHGWPGRIAALWRASEVVGRVAV